MLAAFVVMLAWLSSPAWLPWLGTVLLMGPVVVLANVITTSPCPRCRTDIFSNGRSPNPDKQMKKAWPNRVCAHCGLNLE